MKSEIDHIIVGLKEGARFGLPMVIGFFIAMVAAMHHYDDEIQEDRMIHELELANQRQEFREMAIKAGAAYYHPRTGMFTWSINEVEKWEE